MNESEIVRGLRGIPGIHVELLDRPCDAVVGFRGRVYLMEFKGTKAKLTRTQVRFHREWKGMIHVVRTFHEALEVLGIHPDPPHSLDCS